MGGNTMTEDWNEVQNLFGVSEVRRLSDTFSVKLENRNVTVIVHVYEVYVMEAYMAVPDVNFWGPMQDKPSSSVAVEDTIYSAFYGAIDSLLNFDSAKYDSEDVFYRMEGTRGSGDIYFNGNGIFMSYKEVVSHRDSINKKYV
jgi:hypothetical protein